MDKIKINYFLLASIVLLSACSTKLDVTGKYKETMVVYGLLDQSKSIQYIKVNKAFLGQGNNILFAAIKDSTQYINSLNVKLKRLTDGVEFNLSPDSTIQKDPGLFYSPGQTNAIYSFNSTGSAALDANSQYQLIIRNNETATQVSAQTSLIGDATITSPSAFQLTFNFFPLNNNNYPFPIAWTSGKNAKIYQIIIRLNYIDSTSTGNISQKIDWTFAEQTTQNISGGETMNNSFLGQSFLRYIGKQLSNPTGLLARRAQNIDIILIAGGQELNTYIEVNKPSTSIVQERPGYTNITNGLGVFSSRYTKLPLSKPLSNNTWDSLACGQFTRNLNFLNHTGSLCH